MIQANDLVVRADGRSILDEVSIAVDEAEIVAVMGANGSGKTTLLRTIAGLVEPDAGSVEGPEVVGYAPEDPRAALFAETVAEEVAFFPENRGLDATMAADGAMRQLDVDALRDRNPRSLSFGEQRRVAIAAVLAGEPGALVLDEPTAGLDRTGERELADLLVELEATVLFSTHAAGFAYQVADRIALLADGAIRHVGPAREVLADIGRLETAGIRPPGLVRWATARELDRLPDDLDDAVDMIRGRP